jgi:hypothetical protein
VAPTALVLGRYDDRGHLRVIGRTHQPSRTTSAELAALLTPPEGPDPWPTVLPGGRVGLPGSDPISHTPVAPHTVVEIEVDSAYEAARFRHGVNFRCPSGVASMTFRHYPATADQVIFDLARSIIVVLDTTRGRMACCRSGRHARSARQ